MSLAYQHPDWVPSKVASLEAAIRLAAVNARIGTPGAAERLAHLESLRGTGIYSHAVEEATR